MALLGFRDVLFAVAAIGASLIGSPLVGAELWAAFASRTALVLGVQTYARSQQQKAARRAAQGRGAQDNTVSIRADDYPEIIVYGTARVPTLLVYRRVHGDANKYMTMVLAVPCRHELTAIDDILFDGVSIGELDPNGYVQSGSRWFTDDVAMQGKVVTGGPAGTTITLDHTAAQIVEIDSIGISSTTILSSGQGEAYAEWRDTSKDRVLEASEWSRAGNVITLAADTSELRVIVTYRAKSGGKAWAHVHKNPGLAAGGTFVVDGAGTTLKTASANEWGDSDKLCSIPNVTLTIEYDPSGKVWASGVPQVTLVVRGAKLYDPTKDSTNGGAGSHRIANPATWEFSNCAALCWRDYMQREIGCTPAEIDDSSTRMAVPICKTLVTLRSGGTEEAFTVDGSLSTADTWAQNIERLAMSMIGNAFMVGATWSIEPYGWSAPVATFPEGATADGDIEVDSRPALDEIINAVRGRCVDNRPTTESPSFGVLTLADFPPREIAAYVAEDEGRKYWHDIDLPLSVGFERGQRMATFYAHRARQSMIAKVPFSNEAYDGIVPGKRVRIPWPLLGWDFTQDGGTGKVFQVVERTTEPPSKVILSLKEDAAAIYSWDYTAATLVDPTPQTALPPPNFVALVEVTAVVSDETTFVRRADGTVIGFVAFQFMRPAQDDVVVVLYWKRATESVWREVRGRVGDVELRAEGVVAGDVLNAYVVAFNSLGAPSTPTWIPTYTVGAGVPSTAIITVENELKGAVFEYGTGDCFAVGVGVSSALLLVGRHGTPGYSVPGPESSARLRVGSSASGTGQFAKWVWPRVPVRGGESYVLYASLLAWECDGQVAVEWFDAAGNFLTSDGTGAVTGHAHESAGWRPDNPAHYTFAGSFPAAPVNAMSAEVSVRAVGSWTAFAEKNVWARRPFFARVPSWLRVFPPWNSGPVNMVGTKFLAPATATGLYEGRMPAGFATWGAGGLSGEPNLTLPSVVVPHDADIEDGTSLRIHFSVPLSITGRQGAGLHGDITAQIALVDHVLDAAGANVSLTVGEFPPTDEPRAAGTLYSGSSSFAGFFVDTHFSAPRLMDGVTLNGTAVWNATFRWVKGYGRRFSLSASFDPRIFPAINTSLWSIALVSAGRITVEAIKR